MERARELEGVPGHMVFRSESGARIIINPAVVTSYDVSGETFEAAFDDIRTRQPLQLPRASEYSSGQTTLASIQTLKRLSSATRETVEAEGPLYRVEPKTLIIRLTPRIRITNWVDYATTTSADRTLWDKLYCQSLHHEIAHLLIIAQSYEEALAEAEAFRAPERDAVNTFVGDWFQRVSDASNARHDAYHAWLDYFSPEEAKSGPYLSQDFHWFRNGFSADVEDDYPPTDPDPDPDPVSAVADERSAREAREDADIAIMREAVEAALAGIGK